MKSYIILILVLFSAITGVAQENKVKLSLGVSNTFMNCFTMGNRNFNMITIGIGVDIKMINGNFRFYSVYGYNGYLTACSDIKENASAKNYSLQNHFLGGTLEYHLFNENTRFRPFVSTSFLSEIGSNYRNRYVDPGWFFPVQYNPFPPLSTGQVPYYGDHPKTIMYGVVLYQSIPVLFNVNGGCSFLVAKNFYINLSLGYSLSMMKYKQIKWSDEDDFEEIIKRTPIQKKMLHSIAVQLGLNYTFSFKKK